MVLEKIKLTEMETSAYYRRADILQELAAALQARLGEETPVFGTDRPRLVPSPLRQFAVVRLVAGIQDSSDIHQQATVSVTCFRRDKDRGLEDIPGMQALIDEACSVFPMAVPLFSASKLRMATGGTDDELGFHYVTLQTKLVIRK